MYEPAGIAESPQQPKFPKRTRPIGFLVKAFEYGLTLAFIFFMVYAITSFGDGGDNGMPFPLIAGFGFAGLVFAYYIYKFFWASSLKFTPFCEASYNEESTTLRVTTGDGPLELTVTPSFKVHFMFRKLEITRIAPDFCGEVGQAPNGDVRWIKVQP